MFIKSFCLAMAAAVGIGQAQAATTVDYDVYLRYEGTSFTDYVFYDNWDNGQDYSGAHYPADDPLGLEIPNYRFPGMVSGDIIRFVASIVFPDDPKQLLGQYDNGGRAPVCLIGKTSCTNTSEAYRKGSDDAFDIRHSDKIFITGSTLVGSAFTYSEWATRFWPSDGERWATWAWYSDAHFTVVKIVDTPAPVPLPATAALLPLGIGALALMRRRRGAQTV